MSLLETNLCLLQCWQTAYEVAGEAVLGPFGLSEADIDAVLTVDTATRQRWAALPVALALPRPGLLTALGAGNNASHRRLHHPRSQPTDHTGDGAPVQADQCTFVGRMERDRQ